MATIMSCGSKWFDVPSVPKSHIFSGDDRPGKEPVHVCKNVPIIDLNGPNMIQEIIKASKDFGYFQVINHGVSEDVIDETVKAMKELLGMPSEEISKDADANGYFYSESKTYSSTSSCLWRDNIKHPCHPMDECMQTWPSKPRRYREAMRAYVEGIQKLSLRLLELISKGLGIVKGYLGGISQVQFVTASTYPACPDPTLTLGLMKHFDHSLITILFQGMVEGLQMWRDDNWVLVEAVPNAFVVNIGSQLEIISNGMLKSPAHRVVTNAQEDRTTIASFINPYLDCIIEPAKELVDEANPPLYQPMSFREFTTSINAFGMYTNHAVQNGISSETNATV